MATLFIVHSILGLRGGERLLAREVSRRGHTAFAPDLFGGATYSTYDDAFNAFSVRGGAEAFFADATAAAELIEGPVAYCGFSMGGVAAEMLTLTRHDAVGLILFNAGISPAHLGCTRWPLSVSPQLHVSARDPFAEPDELEAFIACVTQGGGTIHRCDYDSSSHLFMDAALADEYDEQACAQALVSVCDYLDQLDTTSRII